MKSESASALEDYLLACIQVQGLPEPVREYRLLPPRRWRCDFAWPGLKLAVEVEGGGWTNGRHVRGAGFEADCEKYNEAALHGWTVLRVTGHMIRDGRALGYLRRALEKEARQ